MEQEKKLWLIKRKKNWKEPYYDSNKGFVVRAKTQEGARTHVFKTAKGDEEKSLWLNPKFSSCEEITPHGKTKILLIDSYGA